MRAFQQMAFPFEKEHIFMPRAFFGIQENSTLASVPLPAHPSAQSVELLLCKATLVFNLGAGSLAERDCTLQEWCLP